MVGEARRGIAVFFGVTLWYIDFMKNPQVWSDGNARGTNIKEEVKMIRMVSVGNGCAGSFPRRINVPRYF